MEVKSISEAITYSDERFTKKVLYKKGESLAFVLNFKPGQSLPQHTHPETNVFLLVLTGSGTATVDGINKPLQQHDVLHCADQETFSFENTGTSNTSLYVMLNKIPDEHYAKEV